MLKRLLVGIVAVGAMFAVTATYGRVAAQGGGQAGRGAAAAPAPIKPDPTTQDPKHLVTAAQMQKWEQEFKNWGRWGKDDQKGAINLITPAKTKAALTLVKEGTSVSMHRFPDLKRTLMTSSSATRFTGWPSLIPRRTNRAAPWTTWRLAP